MLPLTDAGIKANFAVARSHICNPTSMWRQDWLIAQGIRYGNLANVSDYGLWVDVVLAGGRFANLKQSLLRYRLHPTQASGNTDATNQGVQGILQKYLAALFPFLASSDVSALASICHGAGARSLSVDAVRKAVAVHRKLSSMFLSSRFGEDPHQVLRNIAGCIAPWEQALQQQGVVL